MSIRSSTVRLAVSALLLAFGLGASHAVLHVLEPPGSGQALHGIACDEAHTEASCPICFGKSQSRKTHRVSAATSHLPTNPGLGHLHVPEAGSRLTSRIARPEAARAPPRHS